MGAGGRLLLCAGLLWCGLGCEGKGAPGEVTGTAAGPASTGGLQPAASTAGTQDASFSVSLQVPGVFKVGTPGALQALLTVKAPYHVNAEYPHRLEMQPGGAVAFEKSRIGREAAQIQPDRMSIPVTLTVSQPGRHTVAGTLSFSLCTAEKCVMEKRPVTATIEAS